MPPRLVRRLVFGPVVLALAFLVFTSTPLLVLGAAAATPILPGRLRPLRLLVLALVYLALETIILVMLALLWLASGFGRNLDSPAFRRTHYQLAGWFLRVLVHVAKHSLGLVVEAEGAKPRPGHPDAPLIVLARHAGPGDSFLLIHQLLTAYGRYPRIVLKDTMQWDPCVDVTLNRLPTRFIATDRGHAKGVVESIAELATGMGPDDALVIFPEGANFTERRRLRSIAKLEELGRDAEAARARELRHVLAPRPAGALAAIAAAPEADILLVAHTGLEDLSSVVDLWRGLPMDDEVKMRLWHVPTSDLPSEPAEQVEWLNSWWSRIDAWIEAEHGASHPPVG